MVRLIICTPNELLLTPWEAVGGCGSSSGSVASDMQLKWIGRGVSGALIDFEAIAGQSQNFDTAGVGTVLQTALSRVLPRVHGC